MRLGETAATHRASRPPFSSRALQKTRRACMFLPPAAKGNAINSPQPSQKSRQHGHGQTQRELLSHVRTTNCITVKHTTIYGPHQQQCHRDSPQSEPSGVWAAPAPRPDLNSPPPLKPLTPDPTPPVNTSLPGSPNTTN